MKHFLFVITLMLAGQASAAPLHFADAPSDWTAHVIPPKSLGAQFYNDAEAIINFREVNDTTIATVFVHAYPAPAAKLEGNVQAWHKAVFPNKATVKTTVISEVTAKVGGQWRYVIHFQSETKTMLNTMIMATVVDGKLHVFLIDQQRPLFKELSPYIKQLFKTVKVSGNSDI